MINYSIKRRRNKKPFLMGFLLIILPAIIIFPLRVYSQSVQKDAYLEKTNDIDKGEEVIINFPFPMLRSSVEENFSIYPFQKVSFRWENNNTRVVIAGQSDWKNQSSYDIRINNGRNIFFSKVEKTFNFKTKNFPVMLSSYPVSGEKEVLVDMENPIKFSFDRSLEGYNAKFVVSPNESLQWQMNEEKTQISLLSQDNFKFETLYKIEVFIKGAQQSSQEYLKIGEIFFETEKAPAPLVWNKDPVIRMEQAKKFTQAKITQGKYIDINLSKQMMVIFENGVALDGYLISSGKRGMETPTGTFKIENKTPRAWSKKYQLFMPNWMAIVPSGLFGIHELPVWPGGFQEGASHLGIPVSHGCVRLGPSSAKRVYDWTEIGTPVVIYL
ncbi:MAG: L,D-transpeptidase [Candidatus Moranbacteria bacterium]|nr:L,D-transpeptidase [Candidatus Moranbacteria bacterium]